jgi:hypothetical protein
MPFTLRSLICAIALVALTACSAPPAPGADPTQAASSAFPPLPPELETCVVQPSIGGYPRFARLMHDPQWMPWPSRLADPEWPSGFHLDRYPETVQFFRAPKSGSGRFNYPREWLQFLREMQPDDDTAVWIATIDAGLFNRGNQPIPILDLDQMQVEPIAESVSSGGNVVKLLGQRNGSGLVELLRVEDTPPLHSEINYELTPWLVTKFTSVSIDGEAGNAGGIDVYFPNLAEGQDGYYVDLKRVEPFPMLPLCAIADKAIELHEAPSDNAPVLGSLQPGESLAMREYLPQGSEVWARTDYGWIRILYLVAGQPVYPTDWEMETTPPMVFE